MVSYSEPYPVPRHAWLFIDFARVTLEDLTSDGSLDGLHAELVEAAGTLVWYIAHDTDKLWPGDTTPMLELMGEAAVMFLCECRGHHATHQPLRAILQSLSRACCTPISSRPATSAEQRQQDLAFSSMQVVAGEIDKFLASTEVRNGSK